MLTTRSGEQSKNQPVNKQSRMRQQQQQQQQQQQHLDNAGLNYHKAFGESPYVPAIAAANVPAIAAANVPGHSLFDLYSEWEKVLVRLKITGQSILNSALYPQSYPRLHPVLVP